ncbi:hypothetical protein [Pyrobaculum neutrophilum]|nr:hypothetical protein [Pyrobaculum neutrophilum]
MRYEGALSDAGCDVVCITLPIGAVYLVELKGGHLTIGDAKDALTQLEACEKLVGGRAQKIVAHSKKGGIDQQAVMTLKAAGVALLKLYDEGSARGDVARALLRALRALA